MQKEVLLIVNGFAGKGKSKAVAFELENFFAENNCNVFRYDTVSKNETVMYVARNANEYDTIVCCGGDGTLNETVSGLMLAENRPVLGYIPLGTTNDFASSIGIPRNFVQAAQNIINGQSIKIDIGKMCDRYFTYIAAFGAFTEVSYTTPQEVKHVWGRIAYFFEGISHLSMIKSYDLRIEYDDKTVEGAFVFGAITNSTSVAGFKSYNEDQMKFDDGLFEGLFLRMPKNIIELNNAIFALTMRDFTNKCFVSFSASSIKVHSKEEIDWTVDGEFGGEHTFVDVMNFEKAIEIFK